MSRVSLSDALVAVALVAGVLVAAVRVLSLGILVVRVADLASARFASMLAIGAAIAGRSADVIGIVGSGVVRPRAAGQIGSRIGGAQVGVSPVATGVIAMTGWRIGGKECASLQDYRQQGYEQDHDQCSGAKE